MDTSTEDSDTSDSARPMNGLNTTPTATPGENPVDYNVAEGHEDDKEDDD